MLADFQTPLSDFLQQVGYQNYLQLLQNYGLKYA